MLSYRKLRPAQPGCWGPQIAVRLVLIRLNILLSRPGGHHEVLFSWWDARSTILRIGWWGREYPARWKAGAREVYLGRVHIAWGYPLRALWYALLHPGYE